MAKQYINVTISLKEEYYEIAYAMLMDFIMTGIEERDDQIIVSFPVESWNPETRLSLLEKLAKADKDAEIIHEDKLTEINWNEEWEKHVPAVSVSERVGIAPECKINELTGEIKIIINPKMSFGTGSHETTRLVCRLAEKYVKPGDFWIDAGTGSGVLAVLTAKLGASKVLAFDNNEWSLENAAENFKLNKTDDLIQLENLDIEEDFDLPDADGITANLFLNLVLPSFPYFYKALKNRKGILIISGIMKYNEEETVAEARKNGFETLEIIYENEWMAAVFKA